MLTTYKQKKKLISENVIAHYVLLGAYCEGCQVSLDKNLPAGISIPKHQKHFSSNIVFTHVLFFCIILFIPSEARPKVELVELGNWVRKRKKWMKKKVRRHDTTERQFLHPPPPGPPLSLLQIWRKMSFFEENFSTFFYPEMAPARAHQGPKALRTLFRVLVI